MRASRVAALFVALTLIATYPIILAPGSYTYFGHSDAQLNMWILAWNAHALRHTPLHLFDANIFYPERGTLAYSETLLGYLPIFGPILWLRGSPALAFNAIILFSFAASGFAMYLLARHLTGRQWPAIVAGIVYAFTPYRFVHFPQIQLESMEWFPLAFLCLHLFYERGERRYALGVGAFVAMEALCCVYYAVFLAIALTVAAAVLAARDRRARDWRALSTLLIVACLTAIAVVPLVGEYVRVHRTQHLERSFAEIGRKSAAPETYLASPSRLHQRLWASGLQAPRDYLFPGIAAVFLAVMGLAGRRALVLTYATIAVSPPRSGPAAWMECRCTICSIRRFPSFTGFARFRGSACWSSSASASLPRWARPSSSRVCARPVPSPTWRSQGSSSWSSSSPRCARTGRAARRW